MASEDFTRQLLFGVLAAHVDFISKEQLSTATSTWLRDKSRTIEDVLVQQDSVSDGDRRLLQPLVRRHLEIHEGDPHKSLASLSILDSIAAELNLLDDADIGETLSYAFTQRSTRELEDTVDADGHSSAPARVAAGRLAGTRFRILRPHAQGGLGEVFVAEDTELNREVALKEIRPKYAGNNASRARFLLEAEVTGGLEHPGIVPVYGLGRYDDGRPFYAMRFVKGKSLKEAIERFHRATWSNPADRVLEQRKLLGRFVDVCQAIEYAHSRGVLHRDLKPSNVMLGKYGETLVVEEVTAGEAPRPTFKRYWPCSSSSEKERLFLTRRFG